MNGLKLRSARIARGKTSKQMAELIGRCEASWNQRERGEKAPDLQEVLLVTEFLNLSEQEFEDIFFDSNLPFRKSCTTACTTCNYFIMRR